MQTSIDSTWGGGGEEREWEEKRFFKRLWEREEKERRNGKRKDIKRLWERKEKEREGVGVEKKGDKERRDINRLGSEGGERERKKEGGWKERERRRDMERENKKRRKDRLQTYR